MASVENRIVEMSFDSAKFSAGVSTTLSDLQKLNDSLKKVGVDNNLENIEKSANKIQFLGIGTAIDKLKAKFNFKEADDAFSDVDKASNKVTFTGLSSAIDKIKGKFNFREADDAFASIEKASGKVTFTGLGQALDGLTAKFSTVQAAAAVALGNMVTNAAGAGLNLTKSLSIEPVTGGLKEYETQLNAIQTILANTKASGANLRDVNKALLELNHYADKTIYNFTEMTRNIGTFTAAGVDLKTATAAIKGIANLAALSGSNSQQASTAMYQLSQAISSGRVSLQDWNSVVNAGMGGTVFQRALAQTAVQMGTLSDSAVELKGKMKNVTIEGSSFRESIMAKPGEESWLTKEVLLGTLKQFTGDMTDAELAAQGFTREQIKAIQAQAKTAEDAATKVKTLSQVIDTAREAAGSGWAQTWQIIFGDFGEARHLFTNISNALNGFISDSAKTRNSVLKDWKELGGRTMLIAGIKNVFQALGSVIKPIKDAFREIFPAKTARDLLEMTRRFKEFTETLKIGPETAENLKRTFAGFFAVLDIGKQIVSGIWSVIKTLFSEVAKGSGGFLEFTGGIGDALVALDNFLKEDDRLKNFFKSIGDALAAPIRLLGDFKDKLSGLFDGLSGGSGLVDSLKELSNAAKPAEKAANVVKAAWEGFIQVIDRVWSAIKPIVDKIIDEFGNLVDNIAEAISANGFETVFDLIRTGLVGGIFITLKKALADGFKFDLGGKALDSVTGAVDTLSSSLKSLQTNVKADTMVKIATSVALLAASAVALSLVDGKKLATAMTAIGAGFAELIGAMALLAKAGGFAIFGPIIASGLVILSAAILTLVPAVMLLSTLDWESLLKGLTATGALLAELAIASGPIAAAGPRLLLAAPGILVLAAGLNVLAIAMKIFATMNWEEIAKGLVAVGLGLTAIALGTRTMGPQMLLIGPGLLLAAIGLNAVASAMKIFATMDMATIGKGVLAIAASLVAIGLAMRLMPLTLPLTAAGLLLVGIALTSIAGAIALMGNMNWGTIGKGLATIGASLVILAIGLTGMMGALPGAVALAVAAAGLALIAPTLGLLGSMKWTTIAKGLAALALSLGVIAIAGTAAGPAFVILGIGLGALGLGILAIGKGMDLMASAVVKLGSDGGKGVAVFMAALTAAIAVFPKMITDFIKGLASILAEIVKLAPAVVESLAKIVIMLLDVLIKAAPKVAEAITALITAILRILNDNVGPIISAGMKLMLSLLQGISKNIGKITGVVADIMTKFLTALTSKLPQLVQAGTKFVVELIKGITNNVGKLVSAAGDLLAKFITALGDNVGKIVSAGAKFIVKIVEGIGNNLGKLARAGGDAVKEFLDGIGDAIGTVASAGARLITRFFNALVSNSLKLVDAGWKAIINFVNGLAAATNTYMPQLIQAGARLALAIVTGIAQGLASLPGIIASKLLGPIQDAVNTAKDAVDSILGFVGGSPFVSLLTPDTRALLQTDEIKKALLQLAKDAWKGFSSEIFNRSKEMVEVGKFIKTELRRGLLGSADDISSAFEEVNSRLSTAVQKFKSVVKEQETAIDALDKKLNKLKEADHKDKEAIEKVTEARKKHNTVLAENAHMLSFAQGAQRDLNHRLVQGKNDLMALSNVYQTVNEKLEKANQILIDVKKTRDDAFKSFSDQYAALPDIDADSSDKLATYTTSLQNQVNAVAAYQSTLDQLRALGLDDATYQKLLEEGTADQQFADQLLAGGKTAVEGLNELDRQLKANSDVLADHASHNLYDAGVAAAQGIVDGLKSQKEAISEAMKDIAKAMVKALKQALKIKSPSRVFAELGEYTSQGLADGLTYSSKAVTDAAEKMGKDAMAAVSSALAGDIDASPVIRPVLDLTQVQSEARKLGALTNVTPITAAASYGQALNISATREALAAFNEDVASRTVPSVLKLEQNNYSPKALSETEIYRQTNNQLSQAKAALGLP